jgi:hypothetical protein
VLGLSPRDPHCPGPYRRGADPLAGTTKLADALSANGAPATATIDKPSCFGADSEDLRATVTAVARSGGASARDFTLTRNGSW